MTKEIFENRLKEIEIVRTDRLHRIERYDIEAAALSINGLPIAVDGTLYFSPDRVVYEPDAYDSGLIILEKD